MPQAIDLTVKNGASTPVDKTFNLVTPAAGDRGVAQWALKEGAISSVFPTFTASSHATNNNSRQLTLKLKVPSSYQDNVTGLTNVGSAFALHVAVSVPNDLPEAIKSDCVAYAVNLLNTTLIKAMIRDAVPAT